MLPAGVMRERTGKEVEVLPDDPPLLSLQVEFTFKREKATGRRCKEKGVS